MRRIAPVPITFAALLCACGSHEGAPTSDDAGHGGDVGADATIADSAAMTDAADASDAGARPDGGTRDGGDAAAGNRCAAHDPNRRALFGDIHVHTAYSFDAYSYGTKLGPADAYAIAKGESRTLQGGVTVTLSRPLDFAAVTDHSEFLGETSVCADPADPSYSASSCATWRDNAGLRGGFFQSFNVFNSILNDVSPQRLSDVCGADGGHCVAPATAAWQKEQQATAQANDDTPACTFASLYAYEWTAMPGGSHRHRNIVFRSDRVPATPVTYFDQQTPEAMWAELNARCTDLGNGCDAIAIPHNTNLSNGLTFELESSLTAAQAAMRAKLEPLVEIYQTKGYSECKPGADSTDPLCAFEQIAPPICDPASADAGGCLPLCADDTISSPTCEERLNYVRNALKEGLVKEQQLGVNPLKLGFVAGTDTHNATAGAVDEYQWRGHMGVVDADPQDRIDAPVSLGAGGLAGVWAEENSRESIFDALRRRETFATTGPRIAVRFFGGFGLPSDSCTRPDAIRVAYTTGVPMGGDLTRPAGVAAPSFFIWAAKDPGTAGHPGTPLQRIQVIKGWVDPANGQSSEKVYEVVGNASNGAAVDPATCAQSGPGNDQLCTTWTDPDFAAAQRAFYYARVLENPSCRHVAYDCQAVAAADAGPLPAACGDAAQTTLQERAWSSPIWYRPD